MIGDGFMRYGFVRGGLLTLAFASGLGSVACDRGEPGRVPPPEGPATVSVSPAAEGPALSAYPASVASTEDALLATRTSGTVRSVPVDVGSVVRKGDPLVVLDASDVEARIDGAEAAVRQATKYFQRIHNLAADGAATDQELDDARARLAMAKSNLGQARAQRDYVVLRAPFAGVVASRDVDPGDLAVPGHPVLRLVRPNSLKVVADLPGEARGLVSPGTPVSLVDPATGRRVAGHVTRVSPALEPGSRRVHAEAKPDDAKDGAMLPAPGSFVRLELASPGRTTLWIPSDALVRQGQLEGAFVVESDTLRLRWLRTGERKAGAVEILAGLEAGQPVVRSPGPRLVDGQPVAETRQERWTP